MFRRIRVLDAAAIELSNACRLVLDPNAPDVALREVFAALADFRSTSESLVWSFYRKDALG
jgi:hypothetical protein